MATKKMNEGETLALIRHYGNALSYVGQGAFSDSRAEIIANAERALQLAKSLPAKNSAYLSER